MPDLDHRTVEPPYLRIARRRPVPNGGAAAVWDLRLAQPNVSVLPPDTVHSFEHFLIDLLTAASPHVIHAAPMGCGTGFYLITCGIEDPAAMADLLDAVLTTITTATAVPHANDVECGWASRHSLIGAQRLAHWLLRHRAAWLDPGAEARELEPSS